MAEREFAQKLQAYLAKKLVGFQVVTKEALLYKVIVNEKGDYHPGDSRKPVRGSFAFETDLLVKRDELPLVVCELKYGGFSTHDVMIYSTKSIKHKEVYPYLRYGSFVAIPRRSATSSLLTTWELTSQWPCPETNLLARLWNNCMCLLRHRLRAHSSS